MKIQTLARCLIGVVLIVAIAFKVRMPSAERWASLALAFDAALLVALFYGAFDRIGDRIAAIGLLALAVAGIVLTVNGLRCGCFGAADVPPFAPSAFALAAAGFCAVKGFVKPDRDGPSAAVKWRSLVAPAAVVLTLPWLAFGSNTTNARGPTVAVDLIADEASGTTLDALIEFEAGAQWDDVRAILFVSSSCGTCKQLMTEVQRRWPASKSRWIALVDLESDSGNANGLTAPFLPAFARGGNRLRISTPALAVLRNGGRVDQVFLGRTDDVNGMARFLDNARTDSGTGARLHDDFTKGGGV
ncbi:MAG: hypothetical protein WBD40_22400 [Tepidisphaeraceae bacterium]